jgi:thiamine-monophosphate kinase
LNSLVFHGGEEYEFVFTASPKHKQIIIKNARSLKTPIMQIGKVTSGKGVFVKTEKDYAILKDLGWKHF